MKDKIIKLNPKDLLQDKETRKFYKKQKHYFDKIRDKLEKEKQWQKNNLRI